MKDFKTLITACNAYCYVYLLRQILTPANFIVFERLRNIVILLSL